MQTDMLPLLAKHLQQFQHLSNDDFRFDDLLLVNLTPEGGLACARASKPYTSVSTPGHVIKSGWTPSGKFKPSKVVGTKTDKRAGK